MTDVLLELSQHPTARKLIKGAGLPVPMPEPLARVRGPMPERPLDDRSVLAGGRGALGEVVARTIVVAGANPLVPSEEVAKLFAEPGEAYGRRARIVETPSALDGERLHGIVFDATGVGDPTELRALYDFFHPFIGKIGRSGRVVVLGRPADRAGSMGAAAARSALEGFVRSLAKEIGSRGATANLVVVEEGAEPRVAGLLRWLLSDASAFVTGQPFHVSARARHAGKTPWVRPLDGKVALVTGAARGIGAATAERLALEGAHVVCLDRPDDDGPVSRVARKLGGSVLLADVSDPDSARMIADALQAEHGGVDIVVHNAGVTRDKTLARMSERHWDQAIEINLTAVQRITAALLEGSLRDEGRIVSLSSVAGIAGNMGQTNYGASKAGIIGLTRYLSGAVESRGITVNAVAPGFIETRMTAAVPIVIREAGRRLSALGQGGLPEDVAHAIGFLSTPGASGITGSVLRVCGGALIGA